MKPVLHKVVDKNGNEETVFNPTGRMILYAMKRAKNPGLSMGEVCDLAKIDHQLPGRWAAKYGSYFLNWLEEFMDLEVSDEFEALHAVGMAQALQPGNFQYWREMARTKGVIKEEQPKVGLTINTDFSLILQATGGDLDAARRKFLQEVRGVGDAGRPRVAIVAQPGDAASHPGAGTGTGPMQAGPVEVDHPLGADGGRAEHGEPVPAISESPAFASSYEVLDDGEISSSSEE